VISFLAGHNYETGLSVQTATVEKDPTVVPRADLPGFSSFPYSST
jgi:hypothetical protein